MALSDNPFVSSSLGLDTLTIDGEWRPTDFNGLNVEYAATSQTTKTGDQYVIEAVTSIRAFGVVLGTYTITAEGTRTGDTFTGTDTQSTTLPGLAASGAPVTKPATLIHGTCN